MIFAIITNIIFLTKKKITQPEKFLDAHLDVFLTK